MKKYISCVIFIVILVGLAAGFYYFKPKIADYAERTDIADKIKNFASKDTDFSFAIISDSEKKDDDLNSVYEKIIKKINDSDAKFLVHLGDFTHNGSDKEFTEFKNFMDDKLAMPYYIVAGNHDILTDENNKSVYLKYFGDLYYSWDLNGWHFVVLDNSWNLEGFSEDQLDWLKEDLAKNKKPTLIFMHRPTKIPFEDILEINDGGTAQTFASYDKFYEVINKTENNVKEVYAGHIHTYMPFNLGTTPLTILGSAGSEVKYNLLQGKDGAYNYLEVMITKDGHVNKKITVN